MIEKLDYKNLIVMVFIGYLFIVSMINYNILINFYDSINSFFYAVISSSFIAIILAILTVEFILYNIIEIDKQAYLTILSNKEFEEQFYKLNINNSKITVNQFNKAIIMYDRFLMEKENNMINEFKMSLTEQFIDNNSNKLVNL